MRLRYSPIWAGSQLILWLLKGSTCFSSSTPATSSGSGPPSATTSSLPELAHHLTPLLRLQRVPIADRANHRLVHIYNSVKSSTYHTRVGSVTSRQGAFQPLLAALTTEFSRTTASLPTPIGLEARLRMMVRSSAAPTELVFQLLRQPFCHPGVG